MDNTDNTDIKSQIAKILWDARWNNHLSSWNCLADEIVNALPTGLVNVSYETLRKWGKGICVPEYMKLQTIYDHSRVEWVRNLAKDVMVIIRPDLWRE